MANKKIKEKIPYQNNKSNFLKILYIPKVWEKKIILVSL